jgi:hypothetical protein
VNSTGGVVLIMGGVLALYLLWAANSPINRGVAPPSGGTTPGPGAPSQQPGYVPPQITPPGVPELPLLPPGIPYPNPLDPCNPAYIAVWGLAECRGVTINPPPSPQSLQDIYHEYIPAGMAETAYAVVGGGHPIGTPYGTGVA